MAYSVGDYRAVVRGNLCGGEIWTNTWSFHDVTGGQDPQDFTDLLATMYNSWYGFASWVSDESTVEGCSLYDLFNNTLDEMPNFAAVGSSAVECLPTQLAMRISLKGAGGEDGGPFIGGFCITATEDGLIHTSLRSDFSTAIETFVDAYQTAGWGLCLDRPGPEILTGVVSGRIGRRWDVIRKRGSAISESFLSFDMV